MNVEIKLAVTKSVNLHFLGSLTLSKGSLKNSKMCMQWLPNKPKKFHSKASKCLNNHCQTGNRGSSAVWREQLKKTNQAAAPTSSTYPGWSKGNQLDWWSSGAGSQTSQLLLIVLPGAMWGINLTQNNRIGSALAENVFLWTPTASWHSSSILFEHE